MRVEQLRENFELEIVFRHFPLHPHTPHAGMTLEELFAGRNIDIPAANARMAQLMADEGLPYRERTMTYNSRLAQELAAWADTQKHGQNIHLALFQAYFVDNINLADVDNLANIAAGVGLSAANARQVLSERLYRDVVDADWSRAREMGITGVPTFVLGKNGLVGAQPYEQLEEFVSSAGMPRRQHRT